MQKLIYSYSNAEEKTHTRFISKKTIIREKGNSKTVNIYTYNGKYITTLLLD